MTDLNQNDSKAKQPSIDRIDSSARHAVNRRRSLFRSVSRRAFLGRVGLFTASTAVAGTLSSTLFKTKEGSAQAQVIASYAGKGFPPKAYQVRVTAAEATRRAIPAHPTNGDEAKYANKIATDTRGLPHNKLGEVDLKAYQSLIDALKSGDPNNYEKIILGGKRKLVQPLTPLAVSLTGLNASQLAIPVPPTLDSAEQATELIELAWEALLRDVPFSEFRDDTNNPLVLAAVQELNQLQAFKGPKQNGRVTPQTLFRGTAIYVGASGRGTAYFLPPGVDVGPYISQFLLLNVPLGTQYSSQQNRIPLAIPENDFQTAYEEWLLVQNGGDSKRKIKFDSVRRYLINGRDLAEVAHDPPSVYGNAAWILLTKPNQADSLAGGIGAPYNASNPYNKSKTQAGGSGTFGPGYSRALIGAVSPHAIRASYWQKYYVHRRLRSEAYAGLIHNNKVNKTKYPLHQEALNSEALERLFSANKTYLLPQAYPEGSPLHPAYPGGASVTAGVSVTVLKALFDEDFVIPNPVLPDPKDPTKLIPYQGSPLTVGGELNKLATNIGMGRNFAGIHWRTDAAAALALGEAIAISILRDEKLTFHENFSGFSFTKFDGTKVKI